MWSSFQLIGHSKDYMATVHSGYTNEMWPDFSVLLEYFLNIPQPKLEVDYLISGLKYKACGYIGKFQYGNLGFCYVTTGSNTIYVNVTTIILNAMGKTQTVHVISRS